MVGLESQDERVRLTADAMGRLMTLQPGPLPCTPAGCIELLKAYDVDMKGAHAVVVIDPLAGVLSSGDPFIARRVLFTLGRIAEKSAATVLVTTHGIDTDATWTAARVVWSVGHDGGGFASSSARRSPWSAGPTTPCAASSAT